MGEQTCPGCGRLAPSDTRFCSACGAALRAGDAKISPLGGAAEAAPRVAPLAERRQLTVMFCDLVDSTHLSARLDPEDFRSVVGAYQQSCAEVIERWGGSIAQYLGDGLLVYFGYPTAHEDDALRAVRAGLGIINGLGKLNQRLQEERGVELSLRIGIHTGLVVVGEVGVGNRRERLALGETPNIAARVQAIAEPNTLVVTAATKELAAGYFEFEVVHAPELKGISEPIRVVRVLRASGVESRLEARESLTPMVGRDAEAALLLEGWARTRQGSRTAFLIHGEAGIGKSRLVRLLKERVAKEAHQSLECRASPHFQDTALHPVVDLFERVLQLREGESAEQGLEKLEAFLRPFPLRFDETTLLLGALLSIPVPEKRFGGLTLTPQAQRKRTLESVIELLVARAKRSPLLLVMEDLHWSDASTLEFLNLLLAEDGAPIMTLLTSRPGFQARWPEMSVVTEIELHPIDRQQVEEMVDRITGGKRLPREVQQQLLERSDGVPLFVEEMTRAVLGSGLLDATETGYELRAGTAQVRIPATLQDPLMARLDQQGNAKRVAQLGAVIGRSFSFELIRALVVLDERKLSAQLDQLVDADLLHREGVGAAASYTFRHSLIQQAAYESLLKATRRKCHTDIARTLERSEETVQSRPEILAHHYTQAGHGEQAASYWHRAGQRALERSANAEAISHFRKGLELVAALPPGAERDRLELRLQLGLAVPLQATQGYTAAEVEAVIARVRALVTDVGDTPDYFAALLLLRTFHTLRADAPKALETSNQLLEMAERRGDRELILEARVNAGAAWYWIGAFETAQRYFDQVSDAYDPEDHKRYAVAFGTDPGVLALEYSGWCLWFLGQPVLAWQRCQQSIALAKSFSHPLSEASTRVYAAVHFFYRRDAPAAQHWAEQGIEVANRQGILWWMALGTMLRGWAIAAQGRAAEAIPQIRFCLERMRLMGTELSRPLFLQMLAEAHHWNGETKEGLACFDEAAALLQRSDDQLYEAALVYQMQGDLLLALGEAHRSAAEAYLERSLRIARDQRARLVQLRTALSLSDPRVGRDPSATRELLAEAVGFFPAALENDDLRRARERLTALG